MMAYKGAVKSLMADFAKKVKEKKEYFKEGVELIESALKTEPNNIEIRYLRLTVQEHAPRFLKYHDNISEDKKIILKNYPSIFSKELKALIQEFILKRSEEHTSELQSRPHLVCRLLLEKKNNNKQPRIKHYHKQEISRPTRLRTVRCIHSCDASPSSSKLIWQADRHGLHSHQHHSPAPL